MEISELCFQAYKHYLIILLLKLKTVLSLTRIVLTNNMYGWGGLFSKKKLKISLQIYGVQWILFSLLFRSVCVG